MLNWALKYLSLGFSVIPLRPHSKEPLIVWSEFQKRKATEAEVRAWFTKEPTANIGIVTGSISGIGVVDLDGPEGISQASLMKLNSSVTSLTGRGKHLWYRLPVGVIVPNAVRIKPGVDIRGEGGFIVAPPSIHESGKRYRWLIRHFGKLPDFPLTILHGKTLEAQKDATTKEESWISNALEGMKNGNIDDTLFTICSRLRADNWSSRDALVLLKPHADRVGATPGHLEEKIENVWNRYPAGHGAEPDLRSYDARVSISGTDAGSHAETIEDFFKTEEKVSWISAGLIASNSLGFIVGLPETSKTWFLMDLAIEAARGGKWLNVFGVKKSRVWFIDQERFRGETQRRFKALLAGKNLIPSELPDLRINAGNTAFKLDLDHSFEAFRKRLEENRPDLVIVDSLATFHTKEENNRKDIQEVLERLKTLRNEFKCTFLLIHHENKMSFQSTEEGKEPSLAEMSGNIAIPAAAETVITVRKRIDGSSLIYHTKSTLSKQHKPFEIKVNDLDGPLKIEVKGYL